MCSSCDKLIMLLDKRSFQLSARWKCRKCGAKRFSKEETPGISEKFSEYVDSFRVVKWWRETWMSKNWPIVVMSFAALGIIFRHALLGFALYMSGGKLPIQPPAPHTIQTP